MTIAHAAAGGRAPPGETAEAEEARRKAVEQGLDVFTIVQQQNAVQRLKQANESNPSHPCHNVYPQLPAADTALLPPTVSASYHSSELLSFLAACLQISPKQRWTAAQLLEHPFIKAGTPESTSSSRSATSSFRGTWSSTLPSPASMSQLSLPTLFASPAGFRDASLSDLTAICDILCDKYTLCSDRSHALSDDTAVCECVVQLDDARLTCLSIQLGLQECDVADEWQRAQQRWKQTKRKERADKEARQKRAAEQRTRVRAQSSIQLLSTATASMPSKRHTMTGLKLPSIFIQPDSPPPMHSQSFRVVLS